MKRTILLMTLLIASGCGAVFVDKECARLAKEGVIWKTTVLTKKSADLPGVGDTEELERLNQKVVEKYVYLRYANRDSMLLPRLLHELFTGDKIAVEELEKLGFTLDANDFDLAREKLQKLGN